MALFSWVDIFGQLGEGLESLKTESDGEGTE